MKTSSTLTNSLSSRLILTYKMELYQGAKLYVPIVAQHIPCKNKFKRHLFHRLKFCSAKPISGISGRLIPKVYVFGELVFMGKIIKAYYAPDIHKCIISEGFICKYYGIRIVRDEDKCILLKQRKQSKI